MQVWDTKYLSMIDGSYTDTMLASLYKDVMARDGVKITCAEGFDSYMSQVIRHSFMMQSVLAYVHIHTCIAYIHTRSCFFV